jgi:hypothetical protein
VPPWGPPRAARPRPDGRRQGARGARAGHLTFKATPGFRRDAFVGRGPRAVAGHDGTALTFAMPGGSTFGQLSGIGLLNRSRQGWIDPAEIEYNQHSYQYGM